MTSGAALIQSRDNPLFKQIKRLAQDATAYRKLGQVWLEGDHLCRAAHARGLRPRVVVAVQGMEENVLVPPVNIEKHAIKNAVFSPALFAELSGLESPAREGWLIDLPRSAGLQPHAPTVVLDRVQDAGNVGSILRCASAFGFTQVIALKGTAALWSPKVVRAGMGAHFNLNLIESATVDDLAALAVPLLATSSHEGDWLHRAPLPWPCGWLLGHEGQGVSPTLRARAVQHLRIEQPGGEESLNVAAAAAICLHASVAARAARAP